MSMQLSRSSRLYKFVFGNEEGKLEGFPEPRNERISLGLFFGLLAVMSILRPLSSAMLLLMDAMMRVLCFLVDGSYVRGSLLTGLKIIKIEPWPKIIDWRLSPWPLCIIAIVLQQYWYVGIGDALQMLVCLSFITVIFMSVKPGDKSPTVELAEKMGPVMDEKLRLAYYREPKLFPVLILVN